MLEGKDPLLFLSLICSFIGLVLIYFAARNLQPKEMSISEITPELIGRTVTTHGIIVYKKVHPEGHVFLTISDNKTKIQVPLFAGYMKSLEERNLTKRDFKVGEELIVSGLVDEYRGSLQIIPRKLNDVRIVS